MAEILTKREVLLVGSMPVRPARTALELVADRLTGLVSRVPDGDQAGWVLPAIKNIAGNPTLEKGRMAEMAPGGLTIQFFQLREGKTAADLEMGPYGYDEAAATSYEEFKRLRQAGRIAPDVRFQVTLPGPVMSSFFIDLDPDELIPIATRALAREVKRILEVVPAADLALQFDLAMEVEHAEWLHSPEAFDMPIHNTFHWTLEQAIDAVAELGNAVPAEAELGFHFCTIWHHAQTGIQDNVPLVKAVNALCSAVKRTIEYVHIPTIPEHKEADFAPLADLQLHPETKLFIGVIHAGDGTEGALERIRAAETVVPDFGIASFCGLNWGVAVVDKLSPELAGDTPEETTSRILDLHREIAEAVSA